MVTILVLQSPILSYASQSKHASSSIVFLGEPHPGENPTQKPMVIMIIPVEIDGFGVISTIFGHPQDPNISICPNTKIRRCHGILFKFKICGEKPLF